MDNKKFFDEIRKIIKEEISLALTKKENTNTGITAFNKDMAHSLSIQNEVKNKSKKVTVMDLLNETRMSMDNKTLEFTSDDAKNFMTSNKKTSLDILPPGLDNSVVTALSRDYSELMKVMKGKKNKTK